MRARTDEQKKDIMDRLLTLWLNNKEMRLGQLINNVIVTTLYYIEDYTFIEALENAYGSEE